MVHPDTPEQPDEGIPMNPFHEYMDEYRSQMEKGEIRKAYRGLMEYLMELRVYLKNKYPEHALSGNLYPGYMDMTYFSFTPMSFSPRKLKVAIVFLHETCSFEVWLAGYNKHVQVHYWNLFKERDWKKYHLPETPRGSDSILAHTLVAHPDFRDLPALTEQIERGTLEFTGDIEDFLDTRFS